MTRLELYWSKQGCIIVQPYHTELGAGTLHPATTLYALSHPKWNVAYVQPSIRPGDGRYGDNPNRLYQHHQYQVILKPSPENMQELYLGCLEALGIDPTLHDVRFVEDDWENPSIGAWGLGWEVWCDGMEISQYTYMQQIGGLECIPTPGELTIGLERLAMYIQDVDNVYDLRYNDAGIHYGEVFKLQEQQFSAYALDYADTDQLLRHFDDAEKECHAMLKHELPLPAYDHCLKASHLLNLLDARGVLGVNERAHFLARVRALAKQTCECWVGIKTPEVRGAHG